MDPEEEEAEKLRLADLEVSSRHTSRHYPWLLDQCHARDDLAL